MSFSLQATNIIVGDSQICSWSDLASFLSLPPSLQWCSVLLWMKFLREKFYRRKSKLKHFLLFLFSSSCYQMSIVSCLNMVLLLAFHRSQLSREVNWSWKKQCLWWWGKGRLRHGKAFKVIKEFCGLWKVEKARIHSLRLSGVGWWCCWKTLE